MNLHTTDQYSIDPFSTVCIVALDLATGHHKLSVLNPSVILGVISMCLSTILSIIIYVS